MKKAAVAFQALAFSFVFVLVRGYEFGVRTQLSFLPVIENKMGVIGLGNDFNLLTHRFYHINFSIVSAFFSNFLGLPLFFFLGYLFTAVLFYLGIDKMIRVLFGDRKISVLLLLLLLLWGSQGLERNHFWYSGTFEPYFLSYALAIFSVGFFLEDKPLFSAVFAALCFAVHFQMGLILAAVLLVTQLVCVQKGEFRSFLKTLFLYTVLFAPVFLEHAPVLFKAAKGSADFMIAYEKFRMPHHFLFDPCRFFIFLGIISVGIFSFVFIQRGRFLREEILEKHKKALVLNLVIFSLCLLQYADFYFFKTGFLTEIQFLRVSTFIHFFGMVYLSLLFLVLARSRIFSLNLLVVFLCYGLGPWIFSTGFGYQKYIFVILAPLLVFVLGVLKRMEQGRFKKDVCILFIPLLICLGFQIYLGFSLKKSHFVYDARRNVNDPWTRLCRWVKTNTEKEALFITPPYQEGFIFYAHRPMIAEFGVNPHLPEEIVEWKNRLRDLAGGDPLENCSGFDCSENLEKDFNRLSADQVKALSRKYKASYFVTESKTSFPFVLVYGNKSFFLYDVRRVTSAGPVVMSSS